jgi:hypothetical protein
LKRRKRSVFVPLPVTDRRIRVRSPDFVRLFTVGSSDEVRFPNLAPLPAESAWSAIALISPNRPDQRAGLVIQRCNGLLAFGVGLHGGHVTVETATESRPSALAPSLNQWSFVGVASDGDSSVAYLGTGSDVSCERLPGIATARSVANATLTIGKHADQTFSGAIAIVCLFSDKLSDDTMRSILLGRIDPLFAPNLCFAWLAATANQIDMVSRQAPVITGTGIIPFAAAGRDVIAESSVPITAPTPTPAPAAAPPIKVAEMPQIQIKGAPAPTLSAPPPIEEVSDLIDPAAAARSVLFRELGLVDDPKDGN